MKFRRLSVLTLMAVLLALVSCGESSPISTTANQLSITISSGNIFATTTVTAASGSTVVIKNRDNTPHTITSQSAVDAFDNTGTFDVTVPSSGSAVLTIPSGASGANFFFYCRFHTNGMIPSSGTITLE